MNGIRKSMAVVTSVLLLGSIAACGSNKETVANDKAEIQSEAEDAIKGPIPKAVRNR